jgi:hypothetical protein
MLKQVPTEIFAGGDLALKIRIACLSHCDLQGNTVRITDGAGVVVQESELVSLDGSGYATDEFVVKAPTKPGEYTWQVIFATQEKAGVLHEESSAPFSFTVKPHTTSMAVWDIPSPITFNRQFRIKVGVRCSAECNLAGKAIAIFDHTNNQVATSALSQVRWSDTGGLYWTEVEIRAPDLEGYFEWEARFQKSEPEQDHEETRYAFGFRTSKPPEHLVLVEVISKDTNAPIDHAQVILHPHRGYTDERGIARLMVPKGNYDLYVSAFAMQVFRSSVPVSADVTVRAELVLAPVEDTSG